MPPATISATGDFTLRFFANEQHDASSTMVRIVAAEVVDEHGFTVNPAVPVEGTILIHAPPLSPRAGGAGEDGGFAA